MESQAEAPPQLLILRVSLVLCQASYPSFCHPRGRSHSTNSRDVEDVLTVEVVWDGKDL